MDPKYRIADTSQIITPALIVFRDLVEANLAEMLRIAASPSRLRPHCKTHKMAAVTRLELQHGIAKHKCATFAEAEMLADAGAKDVFLAYNLLGPNIDRAVKFIKKYADVTFSVTADHPRAIEALGEAMTQAGGQVDVLLDLDTGQHRTGIPAGAEARRLYQQIVQTGGLNPGGLHVYDGQNHQTSRSERAAAVDQVWGPVAAFRDELVAEGWPVPRIVAGGTGSFPLFAEKDNPALEVSPGTCVFHDAGYGEIFPDLDFTPASLILTRVVSRPTQRRVTLDLGYKACASDPPAGRRLVIPDVPDAEQVLQNEEHLVIETSQSDRFQPGDELLAIPRHACPTSALHKEAHVVSGGELVDRWPVTARDRWLTI